MRISDWSSDVCSSDLITPGPAHAVAVEIGRGDAAAARIEAAALEAFRIGRVEQVIGRGLEADRRARGEAAEHRAAAEIGERLDHKRGAAEFGRGAADLVLLDDMRLALVPGVAAAQRDADIIGRSEEHTSELQSLMR